MQLKNEHLRNLVQLIAEENDNIEDVDALVNGLKKFESSSEVSRPSAVDNDVVEVLGKANQDLQQKLSNLQEVYNHKAAEHDMLSEDMEILLNEKIKHESEIENLKLEMKTKATSGELLDVETFERKFTEMRNELEEEKQREIEVLKLAREEYEHVKDKAIEENLKLLEDKFEKEREQLLDYLEKEKSSYQQKCEEEQQEILRDYEKLLNDQHSKEQDDLILTMSRQQTEDSEKISNEREATELQERLQKAIAMQEEAEATRDCEKLLKDQYLKEIQILKDDLSTLQKEQTQQDDITNQHEEMKQHKDLVIKKLKLKLKQTISEKAQLNNSLSELMETSVSIADKDNQIELLEQQLAEQHHNVSRVTDESIKQILEKDELISALKDESIWLKESMAPLIAKADTTDALLQDNQTLKHNLDAKDDEISHLQENVILKENELMSLVEQERNVREEYGIQLQKVKLELENKEAALKSSKDEVMWMQSEVNILSPKSDQLTTALEDLSEMKEALTEEVKLKNLIEEQARVMEQKLTESDNIIQSLSEDCSLLQEQVTNLFSCKEELEDTKTQLSELKELYSNQKNDLHQMNDSLKTRETQLGDLRKELLVKDNELEDKQGLLHTKEVEFDNICSILEDNSKINEELAYKEDMIETLRKELLVKDNELEDKQGLLHTKEVEFDNICSILEDNSKIKKELAGKEEMIETLMESLAAEKKASSRF